MSPCDSPVKPSVAMSHTPQGADKADSLMHAWSDMTVDQLASTIKISQALARSMKLMTHGFPDKSRGAKAIEAFTGVVFKAFDYASLSAGQRDKTSRCLRIISSLYGYLRPDDIVKPYRLDFTTVMTPPQMSMARYWRDSVTDMLLADIEADDSDCVLDLMPADAAACIDFKRIAESTKVIKADFKEYADGSRLRTPSANRLKTLRGQLLRHIITHHVTDADDIASIETDTFYADSMTGGKITFIAG